MKKLSKICCGHPDTDVEQPRLVRRSVLQSVLSRPNREVLRVRKVGNAFSVAKARFSPNGISHSIVINLVKEDETKMELIIDGKPFYEADTKEKIRGNAELNIDGMTVDFVWDLTHAEFPNFSFYIRDAGSGGGGSSSGGGGSSSNDGGDAGAAKQWEDHVHVYLLQIMGRLE